MSQTSATWRPRPLPGLPEGPSQVRVRVPVAVAAAGMAIYTRGGIPLVERFVSKAERDTMDEGDFAGKGKSFPIAKPGDIMAAVHSMGRAGSGNYGPAALKARIIAIAKKKGWTKYLPKAWRALFSSA